MRSLVLQTLAITRINLTSLPQRLWMSLSTVVAVALVVGVLLAFLAMGNGFKQTLAGSGSDSIALFLRGGSTAELSSTVSSTQLRLIEELPGVARDSQGRPLVSGEFYVVVDGKRRSTGQDSNLPLRGMDPKGLAVREGIRIAEGRMFRPGSNELVVGRGVLAEFSGFEIGSELTFGTTRWQVVGVFEAEGSVFESELWADLPVVQSLFNRNNVLQSVRAKLVSPEALAGLKAGNDADPRLKLAVTSERAYFAEQAEGTTNLIATLGWPLAITMAIGALAGALNTMYASVASRTSEIATLRTIGFGGLPTFFGTLIEAIVLAIIGGLLGAVLTYLIFDGFTAASLGGGFTQVVFAFQLSPNAILQGVVMAALIGLIGGFFPAIRAARLPLRAALGD
jgi:putative ABC transport system permease protein